MGCLQLLKSIWSITRSADVRSKAYTQSLLPGAEPPVPEPDRALWQHLVVNLNLKS